MERIERADFIRKERSSMGTIKNSSAKIYSSEEMMEILGFSEKEFYSTFKNRLFYRQSVLDAYNKNKYKKIKHWEDRF